MKITAKEEKEKSENKMTKLVIDRKSGRMLISVRELPGTLFFIHNS